MLHNKTMPYRVVKKKPVGKKNKRWYVDASIPKSVPFIGGSSFKAGSGMVKRMVKRELAKQEETKISSSRIEGGGALKHDTMYTSAPTRGVTIGTNDNQRIGNQVYLRHIKLKGIIKNLSTQTNVRFRFLCVESEQDLTGTSKDWGSGLGSTDLFYAGSYKVINSLINNKITAQKVLEDRTILVRSDVNGVVTEKDFTFDCRIMKKVTYKPAGTGFQDKNYYFVIIPYIDGGVAGTTTVGDVDLNYLVTYTDA